LHLLARRQLVFFRSSKHILPTYTSLQGASWYFFTTTSIFYLPILPCKAPVGIFSQQQAYFTYLHLLAKRQSVFFRSSKHILPTYSSSQDASRYISAAASIFYLLASPCKTPVGIFPKQQRYLTPYVQQL